MSYTCRDPRKIKIPDNPYRPPTQEFGRASKIQIAAYGAQDVYLRGTFSPFVAQYKRATRFAVWTDAVDIPWVPGQRTVVDIPKSGDVLGEMFLRVVLPVIPGTWKKCIGYSLFRRVRLMLDGQEIHNYERLWYDIRDSVYAHKPGYDDMVGRTVLSGSTPHELVIPLRFLTETPGFPLSAIPRASLKVDIEWELAAKVSDIPFVIQPQIMMDYCDLENPEKRMLTQGTTLLFESAIDSDALSYKIDSGGQVQDVDKINVNLGNVRFAVKLLAWVAYDETGAPFTYIAQPLKDVSLKFNNQDRMEARPSGYFTAVQQYQHCSRCAPGLGVHTYSFAFDATSLQPSGVADFGALAKVFLQGTVAPGNPKFKLKVFSLYYNVVTIKNGTGHLAFI